MVLIADDDPDWRLLVRDALAGKDPGDWDLTTAARPADVRRLFKRTVPIGVEHGTVGVLGKDGRLYEVTTFRRDVETFGRHAVVAFAETVDEDLARRDFTINALAWHPLRGDLLDPFGGRRDLEEGVLRTVGAPEDRFAEDYLRVLRALRFAGQFDLDVEPETWASLREAARHLDGLSAERVREELVKVLTQVPGASRCLGLYREAGVLDVLYPELAPLAGERPAPDQPDLWTATLGAVDAARPHRVRIRLAALLHGSGLAHGDGRLRHGHLVLGCGFLHHVLVSLRRRAAAPGPQPLIDCVNNIH